MHKLLFTLILTVYTLSNCFAQKTLSKAEINKFQIRNDSVFYENKHIANYIHIEYEYYLGKKTMEICFQQIEPSATELTDKLVDFVHIKHPKAKVEIRIPHKMFW